MATLSAEDATSVTAALLHNVYRAFDRRDESVVYDRLAQSAAGNLLNEIYLKTRQSVELENQGGANQLLKTALSWVVQSEIAPTI